MAARRKKNAKAGLHKHPFVLVTWVDATSMEGWMPEADALHETPLVCYTVGHLLKQDKDVIHLASTVYKLDPQYVPKINHLYMIPRVWIKNIRRLK